MDNHGAIHEEFADFIAATARIAEKRLIFIPKVPSLQDPLESCFLLQYHQALLCQYLHFGSEAPKLASFICDLT